jgi:hypothetical protein
MKNFFHPMVAAMIACTVSNAFAEDLGVKEELALEVIELTNPDAVLDRFAQQMIGTIEGFPGLETDCDVVQRAAQDFREEIVRESVEIVKSPDMRAEMIIAYTDLFSEQELRDIAAFYQTPAGRKVIETMPEMARRQMAYMQRSMVKLQETFQGRMRGLDQRIEAARQQCPADDP